MKALQEKRKEESKWQNIKNAGTRERTIEEKIAHNKHLQYEEHQYLFGVMYTSIHKAAFDGDCSGVKYFLSAEGRKHFKKVNVDDFDKNGICPIHYVSSG